MEWLYGCMAVNKRSSLIKLEDYLSKVVKSATFGYVPINVQNAVCAGDFKTRKSAIFKITVTNIFAKEKVVTVIFLSVGGRSIARFKIWTFIYTKTDITTFSDIKQRRTYINKVYYRHSSFYRHN
jgi:hypothetical protein